MALDHRGKKLDDDGVDGYGEYSQQPPMHPALRFIKKNHLMLQSIGLFLVFFVAIVLFCSVPDSEESGVHFDYIGVSVTQPFLYALDPSQPMDKIVLHLWASVLSHAYAPEYYYYDEDPPVRRDATTTGSSSSTTTTDSTY